ncbi:MAG: FecR domain-containing protein (plasmid) [Leptolyngbya sp. BL-A-14]
MVRGYLLRHVAPLLALSFWCGSVLMSGAAQAEVPLNRAVIASLRNAVELILNNQAPRAAKVRDALTPGDAIATARAALAELRFNDGSLARVGGQALFRFLPHTRTFQLSNGTLLLLVPPGRGQTRIQTPNAAAGIRGSALFVRYLAETDVTLIGALTESGIEITNRDRSQTQPLGAGQMAVVIKDRIEQVYHFDLKTFYETSELVKGLELQRSVASEPSAWSNDPAIAAVRTETSEAVKTQASVGSVSAVTRGAPFDAKAKTPHTNQSPTSSVSASPQTPGPSGIALPVEKLLTPPTASLSTVFPATVTLPTTGVTLPTAVGSTTSLNSGGNTPLPGIPPGIAGNTSGQIGNPLPGVAGNTQSGGLPPGLAGNTPGQAGTTPGQSGALPPGLAGNTPGQAGTTPGQSGALPPGLAGTAPGLAGTTPGRSSR